jgi:hypothetical protein
MKKSIGELIDALSVTNIKIYMMVEDVEAERNTKEDAQKMQKLIKYRAQLTNAINEELGGEENIVKVYGSQTGRKSKE